MPTQSEKANAFKALHDSDEIFVIPNPWDAGSARLLQGLGFKALATTSAGFAQSLGRLDGEVSLEDKLAHCRTLCAVTDVPVSADFENGFSDAPKEVAANVLRAAETGLAGASVEDYSGSGIYDFNHAVERIAACSEAISQLSFPFTLTARAENLLRGVDDLDDTIRRLQAFEAAGANVLYAPALKNLNQVRQVVQAVSAPVNVLSSFMPDVVLNQYAELGVRRISVGGALANHAIASTIAAASEMIHAGGFSWMKNVAPGNRVKELLGTKPQ